MQANSHSFYISFVLGGFIQKPVLHLIFCCFSFLIFHSLWHVRTKWQHLVTTRDSRDEYELCLFWGFLKLFFPDYSAYMLRNVPGSSSSIPWTRWCNAYSCIIRPFLFKCRLWKWKLQCVLESEVTSFFIHRPHWGWDTQSSSGGLFMDRLLLWSTQLTFVWTVFLQYVT